MLQFLVFNVSISNPFGIYLGVYCTLLRVNSLSVLTPLAISTGRAAWAGHCQAPGLCPSIIIHLLCKLDQVTQFFGAWVPLKSHRNNDPCPAYLRRLF